jgi:hypothetical protein
MKMLRTCEAPNCEKRYYTYRLNARFCSVRCKTAYGAWSWPANYADIQKSWGQAKP